MVSTLARNTRDVGSIQALHTIFSILITPMTLVAMTIIICKLCIVWVLEPTLCIHVCEMTDCMYVSVSIKTLIIRGGMSVICSTYLSGKELNRQGGVGVVMTMSYFVGMRRVLSPP